MTIEKRNFWADTKIYFKNFKIINQAILNYSKMKMKFAAQIMLHHLQFLQQKLLLC